MEAGDWPVPEVVELLDGEAESKPLLPVRSTAESEVLGVLEVFEVFVVVGRGSASLNNLGIGKVSGFCWRLQWTGKAIHSLWSGWS